jgi:nicotinamide mononucleotide (NMN) deamidase PncC
VFIAVGSEQDTDVQRYDFTGDPDAIKHQAVRQAIAMVTRYLDERVADS